MAHYFITGHTGFKGSWLIFLLKAQGHEVSGLGLNPLVESIFNKTKINQDLTHDFRIDIRNREETIKAVHKARPDYLIHMAAQAIVREGYRNPLYTYETNVDGTLNALEAAKQVDSIRAQLIVTTDKVYMNRNLSRPYIETDPLGGKNPYSASKAMADILAQEYFSRKESKPGAVARAGNVIGAGDIAPGRLVPDIVRAIESRRPLKVRLPEAIRPWQHVLDCLGGYLLLLEALEKISLRGEFNFGPESGRLASVNDVIQQVQRQAPFELEEARSGDTTTFREEPYLFLNSEKARRELRWSEKFDLADSLKDAAMPVSNMAGLELREHIDSTVETWRTA